MYPNYPPGSIPPPYGFAPPAETYPGQATYAAPPPAGFPPEPQAAYAPPSAAYPPAGYPPQPGYGAPGFPPSQPSYPAVPPPGGGYPQYGYPPPQPGYGNVDYSQQSGYPAQPSYAAQPPYGAAGATYPQPAGAPANYGPGVASFPAPGYLPAPTQQPYYPSTPADQPYNQSAPMMSYGASPMQQPMVCDAERAEFMRLAGDDGEIDAYELQDILNREFKKEFAFDGFSVDMTRSMVATTDLDISGKLGFEEYKQLRTDLTLCRTTFQTVDADRSGYLDRSEFHRALGLLNQNVSERSLSALMMRYGDRHGHIRFNDFVACFIKLRTMTKMFMMKDVWRRGDAEFHRDEFIQLCMYS